MRGCRRLVLASVCAAASALVPAASAAASTTTIGQASGSLPCFAGVVVADDNDAISTGGGVITSFSYGNDGNNAGSKLDFEVLQPNPDGTYTIVANTGLQTLTGANGVETFPANIPVSGGEIIGYYEAGVDNCLEGGTQDTMPFEFVGPDPSPGQTLSAPDLFIMQGVSLNESATLQTAGASALSATGGSVSGTEGSATSGQVASFTDPDNQPASDYSAVITWGDGTTSSGPVARVAAGQYGVSGSHAYAEYGSYVISVQVTDADGANATAKGSATVADAALSASGTGSSAGPVATLPSFSGQVAAMTDANLSGSVKDLSATVDWGDGKTSSGTVTGSGGSYAVSASHAYSAGGPRTVRVHVTDAGGSTADATSYLVVYETANQTGGSFVIGDRATGPVVYFWGSRWEDRNPLSGGRAPESFKGFANQSAQGCGQTFTARPGESSRPAARLPAYMAVAVTGAVNKSRDVVSGIVKKVVVVKTDPGYRPEPGSPGTGWVLATVCG